MSEYGKPIPCVVNVLPAPPEPSVRWELCPYCGGEGERGGLLCRPCGSHGVVLIRVHA